MKPLVSPISRRLRLVGTAFLYTFWLCSGIGQAQPTNPKLVGLTPQQRKIHGLIRRTAARMQAEGIDRSNAQRLNAAQRFSSPLLKVDDRARIHVYVHLSAVTPATLAALQARGEAEIEVTNRDLKIVQAWLPYERMELTAGLDFVVRIRPPEYATVNTGSVNSQGDTILKANLVRSSLGITGAGVKVGVISDGANNRGASQALGDLPGSITTFGRCSPGLTGTTCNEGTAMMEIVYDLAPGASLAMGSAFTTLEFIERVLDLAAWGAKVIVDDLAFFDQPYFEDGVLAKTYANALGQGITLVSAAGNAAQRHYQGSYADGGSGFHNFGGGDTLMAFSVAQGNVAVVVLQWSNAFGFSGDDYDLYILNSTGTQIITYSVDFQGGEEDPFEAAAVYCGSPGGCTFNVQVHRFSGTAQTLELFFLSGSPTEHLVSPDSIFGHAAVPGVIATAAISASDPGNLNIEPYSSRGPSTIFFPAFQQRTGPALTAIDCVSVTGAGGFPSTFCGTSAAAPHAAAVAALILQAHPFLTSAQVMSVMQNTALDRGAAGFDSTYGSGLIDALAAVNSSSNQPPSAVSVTPSSGTGSTQTFSFLFSDPNGFADLPFATALINATLNNLNACYVQYDRVSNRGWLLNDSALNFVGSVLLGTAASVQNSQCILNGSGSSASGAGNNLTVNLALTFKTAFTGAKNVYLYTQDSANLSSGWQQRGTWTVPAPSPPSAVSVTPSSGSGLSQTFTYLFSDPNGFADLPAVQMLIQSSLTFANGCYIYYARWSNFLYLRDNANLTWLGPLTPGGAGTLTNSQCSLNAAGSSASGSGNDLAVNVALSFTGAFAGAKNNYMYAQDAGGVETGWQAKGTWTVSAGNAPSAVSVTPSSGSGLSQTFTYLFSDPNGFADLPAVQMLIQSSLTFTNGCYIYYARWSNSLWLRDNPSMNWLGPLTPGGAGTLTNSQCSLNAGASSASGSGNDLTVNVALTFTAAFAGAKNNYMYAQDAGGLATGWQAKGTWTVPSGNAPSAVSVTPSSGSGSSQTFTYLFSDPNGFADLPAVQMLIQSSLTFTNGCYIYYARWSNSLWLRDNANLSWLGPLTPGGAGTLANSQCSLNAPGSSASGSGNNLTVNVALSFTGAFAGAKNNYMYAQDAGGLETGWQAKGTWTVP